MTTFYLLVVILLNGGGQMIPLRTLEGCLQTAQALYLEVTTEVKCYMVSGNFDFNHKPSFAPKVSPLPAAKPGETI